MKKTKREKIDFRLDVILTKSEEEVWKAECPVLGKISYGRTEEIAVDGLKMAIADSGKLERTKGVISEGKK